MTQLAAFAVVAKFERRKKTQESRDLAIRNGEYCRDHTFLCVDSSFEDAAREAVSTARRLPCEMSSVTAIFD